MSEQPRPLQVGAKGHYIVRMLMVGDSSCGKTSLVLRFDQNVFSTKFVTTIGVDYRDKVVKVRSSTVVLTLFHSSKCADPNPPLAYRSKALLCVSNFGIPLVKRDSVR